MSETEVPNIPKGRKDRLLRNIRTGIRVFTAAIVASRYNLGFILPITDDKSLQDIGLEGLGFRIAEDGSVVEITDSGPK